MKRILIIRLSSMGDIILTFPVIEALRKRSPQSEILFLCKRQYKDLLLNHPHVQEVAEFDPRGNHKGIFGFFGLLWRMRQRKIDLVIDLHSNLRSFLIRNLILAKQRIKYNKRWLARFLMVHFKPFKVRSKHTLDCYMESLERLGVESEPKIVRFYLNDEDRVWAENFLSENSCNRGEILLAMAPGARWPTKTWDKERFARVAEILSSEFPVHLVLLGDARDGETVEWIKHRLVRKTPSRDGLKITKAVDLPLNRVASLLHMCDALVTNDSGLMHLASFLKVPVVAIFGPTHPKLGFAPLGPDSVVISVDEKCSPCSLHGKRKCHRKERYCMDGVSPEKVAEAVSRFLNRDKAVFVDRDGTLIQEKKFVSRVEDVEFVPGSVEAMKMLKDLGYRLVIISNQSGIGRGILTEKIVEEINDLIVNQLKGNGVSVDGVYYCPHSPEDDCSCRKPNLGLIDQALSKLTLSLKNSWVIGDKVSDVALGRNMGGRAGLVLTGYGRKELEKMKQDSDAKPDFVADDLLGAALWIQKEHRRKEERCAKKSS